MTGGTVETAREGRGDGDSLRGSPMTASEQAVSGNITARQRVDTPSSKQEKSLPVSGSAVESSERLAAVVGQNPSGKSRPNRLRILTEGGLAENSCLEGSDEAQEANRCLITRCQISRCLPEDQDRRGGCFARHLAGPLLTRSKHVPGGGGKTSGWPQLLPEKRLTHRARTLRMPAAGRIPANAVGLSMVSACAV